ncbi:MAG: RNA polymerase sigma factor [Verrucomicrobiales bacterium]|nr:RNA polymerase sigma factor [Verrucomicrobiales bacterium]
MKPEPLSDQLAALHKDAFGWALHCCRGDAALAEDVLQNAYVKWLQGRLHHSGTGSVKAWWLEVIRLTAHEEWRRSRRGWNLFERMRDWFGDDPTDEPEDQRPHPARQAELDDESARLRGLLAKLPARQAEVLHLVFYENLTIEEAARVMRVGLGSARTHYERGKRRLREWLESEETK